MSQRIRRLCLLIGVLLSAGTCSVGCSTAPPLRPIPDYASQMDGDGEPERDRFALEERAEADEEFSNDFYEQEATE